MSTSDQMRLELTLLLCLFIGLKLGGAIDWSWWWAMAPLWVPAIIAGVLLVVWFKLTQRKDATVEHFHGGGREVTRPLNEDDEFEMALNRSLGERVRSCDLDAEQLWGSLGNVKWTHRAGSTAFYSFRGAGDTVAAIRGEGNYLNWYCSAPDGFVRDWIASAMAAEGWVGTRVLPNTDKQSVASRDGGDS